MPEDPSLQRILRVVERELGEDARAGLEKAIGRVGAAGSGSESTLPADAEEARAGQMKAGGSGAGSVASDGSPSGDAVTEGELEARLEELREEALTQEELATLVDELEASARETIMEALPEIADETAQKMATGGGYTGAIEAEFSPGERPTRESPGRNPVAQGTARKMDTGGSSSPSSESVDYAEEIAAAFGGGGD